MSRREDRGAVLAYTALCIVVLLTMAAFTMDLGQQMLRRREAQAAADAVAMDLLRMVDGRDAATISTSPEWSTTLDDSAVRNGFTPAKITATLGTWNGTTFSPSLATDTPDAVQVVARDTVVYSFARIVGLSSGGVQRTAVASRNPTAGFSIGSFAASIDASNQGLLNRLLQDALDIGIVSYEGLADANLTLRNLALQLGFVNPEELFSSNLTYRQFYVATAQVLRNGGNTADATAVEAIVTQLDADGDFGLDDDFPFSDVVQVTTPGEDSALDATSNVLNLLSATAFLANGSQGLGIPNLTLSTGQTLTLTATGIKVIQGPTTAFGPVGTSASNSQIIVNATGSVVVAGTTVAVTLALAVAPATGIIDRIACNTPQELDIGVTSGVLTGSEAIRVTLPGVLGLPGVVIPVPTVSLNQSSASSTASFVVPPDAVGSMRSTGSGSVHFPTLSTGGLGLTTAVLNVVNAMATAIDTQLLGPLTRLASVRVGGADVFFQGVGCQTPKLVL